MTEFLIDLTDVEDAVNSNDCPPDIHKALQFCMENLDENPEIKIISIIITVRRDGRRFG